MIAMTFPEVPKPGSVLGRIGSQLPKHVRDAEDEATFAALQITERRRPLAASGLAQALSSLAFNNKILAGHNPNMIVQIGGDNR